MSMVEIHGGLSRDHLVTVGRPPAYDQPGGPGMYAAIGAVRGAGLAAAAGAHAPRVRLGGTVPAGAIRDRLAAAGVILAPATGAPVPALWILNSREGRRVLSTSPTGHELDESAPERGNPESARPDPDTDVLLRCAPHHGLPGAERPQLVLVDPDQREIAAHGWEHLVDLSQTTDVYLPSRVQLSQLHEDPRRAAEEIRRRTGRAVVARLDAEGSLVLPASGGRWRVALEEVTVVDTTGAGDTHAGALAAALATGSLLSTPGTPDGALEEGGTRSRALPSLSAERLVAATVLATAVVARTLAGIGPSALLAATDLDSADLCAPRVLKED